MSKKSEKTELLEEFDSYVHRRSKLDNFYFFYMFLTLIFIAMFAFPKIYITQQIYYKSRDIAKLKHEYETLKEENKIISASVESIKFKNQILDTLF
jgi:cell division protein FtsL